MIVCEVETDNWVELACPQESKMEEMADLYDKKCYFRNNQMLKWFKQIYISLLGEVVERLLSNNFIKVLTMTEENQIV